MSLWCQQMLGSFFEQTCCPKWSEFSSGYFNDRKAFSGKVAQIQLWNGQLLSEDIREMAHCQK
jgi:hypothetical protein